MHNGSYMLLHTRSHMFTGVHAQKCSALMNKGGNLSLTLGDMQWAPLANLFEKLCAQPDGRLLDGFSCARGPCASSSFFIIFECHCHLRVGMWQASLTLASFSVCLPPGPVPPECKEAASCTRGVSLTLSPLSHSFSLLIPQTIFYLNLRQLSHPHIDCVFLTSLSVPWQITQVSVNVSHWINNQTFFERTKWSILKCLAVKAEEKERKWKICI